MDVDLPLLLALPATAALAWAIGNGVRRHAHRIGLVQSPNHRSSHTLPTPHGGGIGIVVASGAALAAFGSLGWAIIALAVLVALLGLWDDIHHLPAGRRLAVHVLACAALLLGFGAGPLGWMLFLVLLLAAVWWLNLFNFMDGIDGLAGSQALFMLLAAATLIAWQHPEANGHAGWHGLLLLAAAIFGFLLLNWPPARLFMGDVGSTYLGFILFALAALTVKAGWLGVPAWFILGAVFITDASATLALRALRGARLAEAHRDHAYQRLARRWGGHRPVVIVVTVYNLAALGPLATAAQIAPPNAWSYVALAYGLTLLAIAAIRARTATREDSTPHNS
jgi:Fuc2NAc and GlcNAc transferase